MARVAFFTERLPPDSHPIARFSYELMQTLVDQGHEIRVFSTYREGAESPASDGQANRLMILRPFKTWGWLELARTIPLLIDFQPDILHFIQPHKEALGGLSNVMSILPALGKFLDQAGVVTSLYDINDKDLKPLRWLMTTSHCVTTSNDRQKNLVEHYLEKHLGPSHARVVTLPATGTSRRIEEKDFTNNSAGPSAGPSLNDHHEKLLEVSEELIFVPGELDEHPNLEALFSALSRTLVEHPQAVTLFGGGWGKIPVGRRHELMGIFETQGVGARVALTGPIHEMAERQCLSRARVVFIASLARESLGLTRVLREAMGVSAPVIMSAEQAELDALRWKHGETALIVDNSASDWTWTLKRALSKEEVVAQIRAQLPEFNRLEVVDSPANVVSRIYAELMGRPL
jgi:glycosyltransferase involved in cell wall biosynthesis